MATIYDRIKELCKSRSISIAKLESELGFGNSSIKKWEKSSSPSVDKVVKVARYFNVTTDYLLGESATTAPAEHDADIIALQRAKQSMSCDEWDKLNKMIRVVFDYAFKED